MLLIASNLPPAPAGKIYEMWMIPKGGKPVPAGLFQSESTGAAMHIQPGPVDADASVSGHPRTRSGFAATHHHAFHGGIAAVERRLWVPASWPVPIGAKRRRNLYMHLTRWR